MSPPSAKALPADAAQFGSPGLKRLLSHNDLMFALGIATVLTTLLIPLPTFILDMLLAISISVSIATLVIVLSAQESLEFSTFPRCCWW